MRSDQLPYTLDDIRQTMSQDAREKTARVTASHVLSARASKGSYALTQCHTTWPTLGHHPYYGAWIVCSPNPFRV